MAELFLKIVNMSIAASWIVLVVILLRLLLKKAPKWIHVVLWGLVAVRLICPFALESAWSLIPSAETISPDIMMDRTPEIQSGIPAINRVVNPIILQSFAPGLADSANPLQVWIPVLSIIWVMGILVMVLYTAVSYWNLHRRVKTAVRLKENIFQSENVVSPFVLGILKPCIYLPFTMGEMENAYVIAHEQTHIRRKDHWWKPVGFMLLMLHWFNPIMWVAYILLCRDIELACDEKVVADLAKEQQADYAQALLSCSVSRKILAVCPLAFGEVGVKERVKSVLRYKKPAFWVIVVALVACIAVALCFLTNPKKVGEDLGNPNTHQDDTPANRLLDTEIAALLDTICASPAYASNPGAYIEAHKEEYNQLLLYDQDTLQYCFRAFLKGNQNDLRGVVMAELCDEICLNLGCALIIDTPDPVTGQAWFDKFKSNAENLAAQFSDEEMQQLYQPCWILLQIMEEAEA